MYGHLILTKIYAILRIFILKGGDIMTKIQYHSPSVQVISAEDVRIFEALASSGGSGGGCTGGGSCSGAGVCNGIGTICIKCIFTSK